MAGRALLGRLLCCRRHIASNDCDLVSLLGEEQEHSASPDPWIEPIEFVRRGRSLDRPRMKARLGFLLSEKFVPLEVGSDCVESENDVEPENVLDLTAFFRIVHSRESRFFTEYTSEPCRKLDGEEHISSKVLCEAFDRSKVSIEEVLDCCESVENDLGGTSSSSDEGLCVSRGRSKMSSTGNP